MQELLFDQKVKNASGVIFHPIAVGNFRRDNEYCSRCYGKVFIFYIVPTAAFNDYIQFVKIMLMHQQRKFIVMIVCKPLAQSKTGSLRLNDSVLTCYHSWDSIIIFFHKKVYRFFHLRTYIQFLRTDILYFL